MKNKNASQVERRAVKAGVQPRQRAVATTTVRFQRAALRPLSVALYSAFASGVAGLVLPATLAWANPQGQLVVQGSASFQSKGNTLTVTTTPGAAINWQSFSIKANETTHFQQTNSASSVLNRVINNNPSELLGNLSSNGKVVLINPFGITVGKGAAVDTAGFTASTLNITDADWANGKLRFKGNALSGDVKVDGVIRSANGDVMLFAPNVTVGAEGIVKADNGNVIIGAGQKVEVTGRGLEGIRFEIQSADNKAVNLGRIEGNAVGIFAGTLRHSGAITAQTATLEGGKVVLRAVKDVEISAGAKVSADGAAGKAGGQISISSATGDVLVGAGSRITANGGAGAAAGGSIGITAEQGKVGVEQGAIISANGAPAGSIRLFAATETRVAGVLTAVSPVRADSGTQIEPISIATGGKVEVLGKQVSLMAGAQVDVSGDGGGGVILVGGDFQGRNAAVPNAQNTSVAPGVTLTADGRAQGDGGKVIVWADNDTYFAGTISAQGGLLGGNGGNAETSGKHALIYRGRTNLSALRGNTGTLLLDPDSIVIQSGSQDGTDTDGSSTTLNNGSGLGTVNTGTGGFTIYQSEIENTDANILLVANKKISTSGSFITSGGSITLLANRDLTMQVTNATITGDGINLTTSLNGSALKFAVSGTGSINLSTTGSSANGTITIGQLAINGSGSLTVNSVGDVLFANNVVLGTGGAEIMAPTSTLASGKSITGAAGAAIAYRGSGTANIASGAVLSLDSVNFNIDHVNIQTLASVTGSSVVQFAPTTSVQMRIGGTNDDSFGTLGVTAAELTRISTPYLRFDGAGSIVLDGSISLGSAGSTLLLNSYSGSVTQVTGVITAAELGATGVLGVSLGSANAVGTFAGRSSAGAVFFNTASALTVGNVWVLNSSYANGGALNITAGASSLTINHDISAKGGDIYLAGSSLQTGGVSIRAFGNPGTGTDGSRGGNITLKSSTGNLVIGNNAQITSFGGSGSSDTTSGGTAYVGGTGGDITIDAFGSLTVGSGLVVQSAGGYGGYGDSRSEGGTQGGAGGLGGNVLIKAGQPFTLPASATISSSGGPGGAGANAGVPLTEGYGATGFRGGDGGAGGKGGTVTVQAPAMVIYGTIRSLGGEGSNGGSGGAGASGFAGTGGSLGTAGGSGGNGGAGGNAGLGGDGGSLFLVSGTGGQLLVTGASASIVSAQGDLGYRGIGGAGGSAGADLGFGTGVEGSAGSAGLLRPSMGGAVSLTGSDATGIAITDTASISGGSISITANGIGGTLRVNNYATINSEGPGQGSMDAAGMNGGAVALVSDSGAIEIGTNVRIESRGGRGGNMVTSGGTAYAGGYGSSVSLTAMTTLSVGDGSVIRSAGGSGGDGISTTGDGAGGGGGGRAGNVTLSVTDPAGTISMSALASLESSGGSGGYGASGISGTNGVAIGEGGSNGLNGGRGGGGGNAGNISLAAGTLAVSGYITALGGSGLAGGAGGSGGNGGPGSIGDGIPAGNGGGAGNGGNGGNPGDGGSITLSASGTGLLQIVGATISSAIGTNGARGLAGLAGVGGATWAGGGGGGATGAAGSAGSDGYATGSGGSVSIGSLGGLSISSSVVQSPYDVQLAASNNLTLDNSDIQARDGAWLTSSNGSILMTGTARVYVSGLSSLYNTASLAALNSVQVTQIEAPAISIQGGVVTISTSLRSSGGTIGVTSNTGTLSVAGGAIIESIGANRTFANARKGGGITLSSATGLSIGQGVEILSQGGDSADISWPGRYGYSGGDGGTVMISAGADLFVDGSGAAVRIRSLGGNGSNGLDAAGNGTTGGDGGYGGTISLTANSGLLTLGQNVSVASNAGRAGSGSNGGAGGLASDGYGQNGFYGGSGGYGGDGGTIRISAATLSISGSILSLGGQGGPAGTGGAGSAGTGLGAYGGTGGHGGYGGSGGYGGDISLTSSSGASLNLSGATISSVGAPVGMGAVGGAGAAGGPGGVAGTAGADNTVGRNNAGGASEMSITSSGGLSLVNSDLYGRWLYLVTSTGDLTVTGTSIFAQSEASLSATAGSILMNPASSLEVDFNGYRAYLNAAGAMELGQISAPRIFATGASVTIGGNLQGSYGSINVLAISGTLSVSDNVSISTTGPIDTKGYGYYAGDISLSSQMGSVSIGKGVQIFSQGGNSGDRSFPGSTAYSGGSGGDVTITADTSLILDNSGTAVEIYSLGGRGGSGLSSSGLATSGGAGGRGGDISLSAGSGLLRIGPNATVASYGGQGGSGSNGVSGGTGQAGENGGDGATGGSGGNVTLSAATIAVSGSVLSLGGLAGNGGSGGNGGEGTSGGNAGDGGLGGRGGAAGLISLVSSSALAALQISGATISSAGGSGGAGGAAGSPGLGSDGPDGTPGTDYSADIPVAGNGNEVSVTSGGGGLSLKSSSISARFVSLKALSNDLTVTNMSILAQDGAYLLASSGSILMSGTSSIDIQSGYSYNQLTLDAANNAQLTALSAPRISVSAQSIYSDALFAGVNLTGNHASLGSSSRMTDVGSMIKPLAVSLNGYGALDVFGKQNVWISTADDLSIGRLQVNTAGTGTVSVVSGGALGLYLSGTRGSLDSSGDVGVSLSGANGLSITAYSTVQATGSGPLDLNATTGTLDMQGSAYAGSGVTNITAQNGLVHVYAISSTFSDSGHVNITGQAVNLEGIVGSTTGDVNITAQSGLASVTGYATSGSGQLNITGKKVLIGTSGIAKSLTGLINLTSTGTGVAADTGLDISGSVYTTRAVAGGAIVLVGDSLAISGSVSATGNADLTVGILPTTTGREIDFISRTGTSADPSHLSLYVEDLNRISASTVQVGDLGRTSGNIRIVDQSTLTSMNALALYAGGSISQGASLTAPALTADSKTTVNLTDAGNSVPLLSGHAAGGFTFFTTGNLSVGTVAGIAGVTADNSASISLSAAGDINVNADVKAGTLSNSGNGVTLTSGGVTSINSALVSGRMDGANGVVIVADDLNLNGTGAINAGGSGIALNPFSSGRSFLVGAGTVSDFALTSTELGALQNYDVLRVGLAKLGNQFGSVTVNTGWTVGGALQLRASGDISLQGPISAATATLGSTSGFIYGPASPSAAALDVTGQLSLSGKGVGAAGPASSALWFAAGDIAATYTDSASTINLYSVNAINTSKVQFNTPGTTDNTALGSAGLIGVDTSLASLTPAGTVSLYSGAGINFNKAGGNVVTRSVRLSGPVQSSTNVEFQQAVSQPSGNWDISGGTTRFSSATTLDGGLTVSAGKLDVNADVYVNALSNGASGTITLSGGDLRVASSITSQAGLIDLGGFMLQSGLGGINNMGTISGAGIIQLLDSGSGGTLFNNGTLSPGGTAGAIGTLTIKGAFQQNAGGTLAVRVNSASTNDLLDITGGSALGGTLAIANFPGYTMGSGENHTVLAAAFTTTGTFTVISGPAGVTLIPAYNPFSVVISTTPVNNWIGTDGDWNTPGNWSLNRAPLTGDIVNVNPSGIHTITLTTAAAGSLYSLNFSAGNDDIFLFSGAGASLTLPGLASLGGTISLAGGTLTNGNAGQGINRLVLSSGSINNTGSLNVASMQLSGGNVSGVGTLNVAGAFNWSNGLISGGTLSTASATTLASGTHGLTSELWINTGTVNHSGGNFSFTNSTLSNQGVFTDTGAGGALFSAVSGTNIVHNFGGTFNFSGAGTRDSGSLSAFNNDGTISVANGAVANIQAGGSDTGLWNVASGAALAFTAGSRSLGSGTGNVTGSGSLSIGGGSVSVSSPSLSIAGTGSLGMTGGTLSLNTGSAISFANPVSLSGSSNLLANNGASFTGLSLASGATLGGSGNKLVTGSLSLDNSTLSGGTLTTQGSSTVSGTLSSLSSLNWQNQGSLTVSVAELAMAGSSITNTAAATLSVQGSGGVGFSATTASAISNDGLIRWNLSSGSRSIASLVNFTNSSTGTVSLLGGTMDVASGTFTQAGTLDIAGGAVFKRTGGFANSGRILGTGSIEATGGNLGNTGLLMLDGAINLGSGTLTNSGGSIRPGDNAIGTLAVTGNLNLSGGTVNLDLASGSSYDRITVSGNITTGGTLNVSEVTPFIAGGDSFGVLTFGGVSSGAAYTLNQAIPDVTLTLGGSAGITSLVASSVTNRWKDNLSGNWEDASKWARGHAPNSLESVVINPAGKQTILLGTGTQAGLSLQMPGDDSLSINGGTLNLSQASSVGSGATLSLLSGNLNSAAGLNIASPFDWAGGTIGGLGTLATSGVVTLSGSGTKNLDGKTWNITAGTVGWTGGNVNLVGSGASVNVAAGARFNVATSDSTASDMRGLGTFNTAAGSILNLNSPLGSSSIYTSRVNLAGTTNLLQGNWDFDRDSGGVTINVSGTVNMAGGTSIVGYSTIGGPVVRLNFNSGSAINVTSGTATLNVNDWDLFFNSPITLPAALNVNQGGGNVTAASALTVGGAYTLSGGTLAGAGIIGLNGAFNWGGGTVAGPGTLSTAGTSTLGNTTALDGRTWRNSGSISIGSGTTLLLKSGAQLANLAAGTLSVGNVGGQGIGAGTGAGSVSNAGLLDLINSTIATGGGNVTNTGLLKGSGLLDLAGIGTLANSGTLRIGGAGTVGTLSVIGNANLTGGTLELDLASLASYDRLSITGNLTQGGTISLSEGLTPFVAAGDAFNVVTYGGTLSGAASALSSSISGVSFALNAGAGALQAQATMVLNSWKDGVSGDWGSAANWTRGHTPNSLEDALIAPSGSQTITLASGSQAPRSLQLTGDDVLALSGGTLSLSNASTVGSAASLLISGGMLAGTGNLDIAGSFVFSGGTLGGTGTLGTTGASTIATGANPRTISRDWNNAGTLTWDSGSISLNSKLFNAAGGKLNINIYDGNDDLSGSGTLVNASGATLRVSSSAFDTTFLATLVNDGSVFIDAGKLDLHKGATHTGAFIIAAGAELRTRDNETHTFASGSAITGAGTYRQTIDAPTVYVQGSFTPANVELGTGTLAFTAGGAQSVSTLAINGGTLSLGGTLSAGSVSVTPSGASVVTIIGNGLINSNGLAINTAALSTGYVTIGSGAGIAAVNGTITGVSGRSSGSDLVLDGRLSQGNGTAGVDYLTLTNAVVGGSGTLAVGAGTLDLLGNTRLGARLQAAAGSQVEFLAGSHTLSGAGSKLDGALYASAGSTVNLAAAGLTQAAGGQLDVWGDLSVTGGAIFGGSVAINSGSLNLSGPAVSFSGPGAQLVIGDSGTLNAQSGTHSLAGNQLLNSGVLHVYSGARADLSTTGSNTPVSSHAGTISIDAGGVFALAASGTYTTVSGAATAISGPGQLSVSGGTLVAGSRVDVGLLDVSAGSVSVSAANLTVGQFFQSGGQVSGNGDFRVSSLFSQTAGTLAAGFSNISITQQQGNLAVGSLQATNTISLTAAGGSLTDSNGVATNATAASVKLLALNGIDLDLSTPMVDATLTSTGKIDLSNIGALQVAGLSASAGSASIATTGALTQGGAIRVLGATTLASGGAGITLTNATNGFGGTVSLVGAGATQIRNNGNLAINGAANSLQLDAADVQMSSLTISGPLTIVATGQIGQGSAINVTGLSSFSAASIVLPTSSTYGGGITFNSPGDVTLNSGGAMVLAGTANHAGGKLSLTALGAVSQTAALTVNASASVSAAGQSVNFGTQLNDFSSVSFTAASAQVRDINSLSIGGNVSGNVAVQAVNGVSDLTGNGFSFGSLDVNLSGTGAANFAQTDVAGAARFTNSGAGSYSSISYQNNSIAGTLGGSMLATGLVNLAFKNKGLVLPRIQAGTLTVSAGGAITQTGALDASVTSMSGQSVVLDNKSNHLGALTLNATSSSINDAGTLRLKGLVSGALIVQAAAISQSVNDALETGSAAISGASSIALIGTNHLGTLSAASGGAIAVNDIGTTLALGNISTPASLMLQSGGSVVQVPGTTLSSGSLDMIALSIGTASQPLEFVSRSVQLYSVSGDINAHSSKGFNLSGLGAAGKAIPTGFAEGFKLAALGATGSASLVSDGAVTVSGPVVTTGDLSIKATNLLVQSDISGAGVTLDAGQGPLVIGGGATSASVAGANSVALIGRDITLLGGMGKGASAQVLSDGNVSVNAAGNFVIQGGSETGASAQISANGPVTITTGGAMNLIGGTGDGTYARVEAGLRSLVSVTAQSLNLQGGDGPGAYAALISQGNVTVAANNFTMAVGKGLDADAVVISYFGKVILPSCNGCVTLTSSPIGNGITDAGVLGGDDYRKFDESVIVGSNELIRVQEFLDKLEEAPHRRKKADDIVVDGGSLTCRAQ
jgi:filamentous hemagglutinin family protein